MDECAIQEIAEKGPGSILRSGPPTQNPPVSLSANTAVRFPASRRLNVGRKCGGFHLCSQLGPRGAPLVLLPWLQTGIGFRSFCLDTSDEDSRLEVVQKT